jgi:uncharacterized protein YqjF (DUF2071 family)
MTQTWHDLLFAHWPVDPALLRALVPAPFEIDAFDRRAWIGIVPFSMTNVAPRGVPSLPWVSTFPELNVRTYVRVGDRPGIYFFSLDAGNAVAANVARILLNLPYYTATMSASPMGDGITYRSLRRSNAAARFDAAYRPVGPSFVAAPGTLEHFLTERYCLYQHDRSGQPYRLEIHHPAWQLRLAQAEIVTNTMAAVNGLRIEGTPTLLHFVRRQDMIAWAPSRLR